MQYILLHGTSGWGEEDYATSYNKGIYTIKRVYFSGTQNVVEHSTGITDRNCKQNIYDLAGNLAEWTTEIGNVRKIGWNYDIGSLSRGPSFIGMAYVGNRGGCNDINYCNVDVGFRPVLYIVK